MAPPHVVNTVRTHTGTRTACSLQANPWRAQRYVGADLVQDVLTFTATAETFGQTLTAYASATCVVANSLAWEGQYLLANATSLQLQFMRCTVDGPGCLSCAPTSEEWVGVSFAADCTSMVLEYSDGGEATYFAADP